MITYIGNCNIIDWNSILEELSTQVPGYVGPRQNWDDPAIKHIADIWKTAGYKPTSEGGSAEWSMYFPGDHFNVNVANKFAEFAKMDHWTCAWISRILPGHCAPLHIDSKDANTITPDRIHCHIDTIDPGHVLIVEDTHLYNQAQGESYRWSSPELWHSSFNIGKKPSYLFNIY
jgi:hypothetical protein